MVPEVSQVQMVDQSLMKLADVYNLIQNYWVVLTKVFPFSLNHSGIVFDTQHYLVQFKMVIELQVISLVVIVADQLGC